MGVADIQTRIAVPLAVRIDYYVDVIRGNGMPLSSP